MKTLLQMPQKLTVEQANDHYSENVSKRVTICVPQDRPVHLDSSCEHSKFNPIWRQ